MSREIWKFPLDPKNLTIKMPRGAVVLCAREQHDSICVWAEVSTQESMESRTFDVYGTGHTMPLATNRRYIGTVIMHGGSLVFHVYEQERP